MKLVEMKCKNCGALLQVDDEAREARCTYCNATFKIVDESAMQAGYDFEKGRMKAQQEIEDEAIRQEQEEKRRIAQFEQMQRERARQEAAAIEEKKKRNKKVVIWVIGWIFFAPIALSVFIWRRDWDKNVRIAVIATIWLVVLIFYSSDIGKIFNN